MVDWIWGDREWRAIRSGENTVSSALDAFLYWVGGSLAGKAAQWPEVEF